MGIVEVPVFSDVDLRPWLCWMEQYFSRKQLTDFEKLHMAHGFIWGEAEWYINSLKPMSSWKEMKETLLLKFGADDDLEKMILKAGSDRCHSALMNDDSEKRQDSRLCSGVISSVESTLKVPCISLEPHKDNISLGYRHSSTVVEKRDRTCSEMTISELARTNKAMWFSKLERFFSTYEDEDKLTLVYYYLEGDVLEWFTREKCRMNFKNWSDFKCRLLAHFCPVTACSSVEVHYNVVSTSSNNSVSETELVKKKITSPNVEEINEVEVEFKNDSLSDMKQHEESSLINAAVLGTDIVKDESTSLSEGVHETEVDKHNTKVEEVSLNSVAEVDQKNLVCESVPETEMVKQTETREVNLKEELPSKNEAVLETYLVEKTALLCPDQETDVKIQKDSLEEREQMAVLKHVISVTDCVGKADLFLEKVPSCSLTKANLIDGLKSSRESVPETELVLVASSSMFQSHDMHAFSQRHMSRRMPCKKKKGKYPKAWKFKFKTMNLQRNSKQLIEKRESKLIGSMKRRHDSKDLLQLILGDLTYQVKHKWRMKNLKPVSALACMLEHVVAEKFSADSVVNKRIMSRRDHNHFSVLLEQMGVVWLWVCSDFTTSLADARPEWQRSLIIFFCSSLRASLFSRAGVYKGILTYLMLVTVWVLRYDEEQKGQTELMRQELFHTIVSSRLDRLLPPENDMLLMYHEGKRLTVRVQQSHKKNRPLKTYMFKYKQLLGKIGAWPEIQQLDVQRAYVYADNRSGNKVMQKRQRSKMAKFWMFKYKEKEAENAVLISVIMIFSMGNVSLFSSSKLVGKLVFMGEVLINIKKSISQKLMTWWK